MCISRRIRTCLYTGDAQICIFDAINAFAHCHHLGIVHRDIKMENLMLRGRTIDEGVLVVDFGLAAKQSHPAQLFYDTAGTNGYRAPEVGASAGFCPRKADVWSLGIVLFAWCHGGMPFYDASAACPRFSWFQEHHAAGVSACDAIYSFGESVTAAIWPEPLATRPLHGKGTPAAHPTEGCRTQRQRPPPVFS